MWKGKHSVLLCSFSAYRMYYRASSAVSSEQRENIKDRDKPGIHGEE